MSNDRRRMMTRKTATGTLEEYYNLMDSIDWKSPAGMTSNCCSHYDIIGVAETDTHQVVALIYSEYTTRNFVTPIYTYDDGTSEGNYGTPTSGVSLLDAIKNFNKDILDSRQYGSKLGIITNIIMRNGERYTV